jgi:hypothetical protein
MSKKLVYIILAALFIFGLLFLAWAWLFSGSKPGTVSGGFFGTASDTTQTGGDTTPGGNFTTTLGGASSGQNSANGTIPLNGTGGTNGTNGNNNTTGSSTGTGATLSLDGLNGQSVSQTDALNAQKAGSGSTLGTGGTVNVPGVVWLGGTTGTNSFGSTGGNNFTPADINSITNASGGFTPTITSNPGGSSNGTTLVEALAATAIAGSLTCALQAGVLTISGTGASAVAATTPTPPAILAAGSGPLFVVDLSGRASASAQAANNTSKAGVSFSQCLINVIGKVALQQITISVVNWINSGFNGQPSFINNFQQFFTNVADLAAGSFIQGSGLAFLCSPFQLQIKIAIAQSYANRGAQSCSLTGIINNINNFMNGSFTQGGWPGLLQFTTVPTNNPYGAFAYAQVGLVTAQSNATNNARNSISPNGFLGLQKQTCNGTTTIAPLTGQNGQAALASNVVPSGCKVVTTTPGKVIEDSLQSVNDISIKELGIGNSVDQIISALTTQMMTKILQNGLSTLSQGTTQTAGDLAAQQQAANLLIDMQGKVSIAQQIGTIDQSSISDIVSAQSNLNNLANCWSGVAASGGTNAAAGTQNAATASTTLQSLNTQIDGYNNNITQLNAAIVSLDGFEAQVSSAATAGDVAVAAAGYNAAVAAGTFPSQTDITTAQQNRVTLQSQMSALNQSTQTSLQQCNATH